MLHEILLALAGQSSPLIDDANQHGLDLSTSERQLLTTIGALSKTHQALRERLKAIAGQHQSVICQAVANTIRQVQLDRFLAKIIEVEKSILSKDSALVGAYDIVPLAAIVGQLDEWQPRLRYLQEVTDFMASSKQHACTGADLINKLRADTRTGFSDLELIAVELSRIAEIAWLQQISTWLLYGKISSHGEADFFVRAQQPSTGHEELHQQPDLLPRFVTSGTAESILFIGRTVREISRTTPSASVPDETTSEHLRLITELSLPIMPAQLHRTMMSIRASISRNVLQHLLPTQFISLAIASIHQYFLFRDVEFATYLVEEAECQKESQWQHVSRMVEKDPIKAMRGLSLKSSEVQQTLDKTWLRLAATHDDEYHDELIEFARLRIKLSAPRKTHGRPPVPEHVSLSTFDDILLPVPANLQMDVSAPLQLFINSDAVEMLSTISSCLLATHRARMRLSDLWRRTASRRSYSRRAIAETNGMRNFWHTCNAALFFLSELTAYQNGEVLTPACSHFQSWTGLTPSDGSSHSQRDPETLARDLRLHLESITHALLFLDAKFTNELRSLLSAIDHLTALFIRLLDVQDQPGLTDDGQMPVDTVQTAKACDRVNSGLQSTLVQLRHLAQDMSRHPTLLSNESSDVYQPYLPGGLDRLLVKLQYSQLAATGGDDDDEHDDNDN